MSYFEISPEDLPAYEKAAIVVQKYSRGVLARKLRKREIVKIHIVKEILDTEESFVNQLRHLVLDYMAALGKRQVRVISLVFFLPPFFIPLLLQYLGQRVTYQPGAVD